MLKSFVVNLKNGISQNGNGKTGIGNGQERERSGTGTVSNGNGQERERSGTGNLKMN